MNYLLDEAYKGHDGGQAAGHYTEGLRRVRAEIGLDAVRRNMQCMHELAGEERLLCAVIKADGYGHGAVMLAETLEELPYIWGFAVANVTEAAQLISAGVKKPILILGYVFPEEYPYLVRHCIRTAVFTEEMAGQLALAAEKEGCSEPVPVHIALDTGMSRIGFADTPASADAVCRIAGMPGLKIEGMFSHFARADEADKSYAAEALSRYLAFDELLRERGVMIPIRHIGNSAAILEFQEAGLDMMRAGITLYGIYPSDEMRRDKTLYPVMAVKSHISYIKTVPAGTPVSYGGTFVTERETRIATIPVGYADGYPRLLSGKGSVLIRGRRAPILGRVCMDQFMVDVTGIGAELHDEAVLMGKDGGDEITVEELGELSGRFPYEFVCDIGKRVPRVYLSGDLS